MFSQSTAGLALSRIANSAEQTRREEESKWFGQEVEPHTSDLKAWLVSTYGPLRDDVDDIVQEAHIRLLKIQSHSPIASARPYLYAVARKVALEWLRDKRIKNQFFTSELVSEITENVRIEQTAEVVRIVTHNEDAEIVAEAIKALPDRCRQIIMLRVKEGLTHKEIAARLGLAEQTVRVQMCRAVQHCAHFFEQKDSGAQNK